MPRNLFWIAASCILALLALLPAFSSGASPTVKEKVIYSFTGGTDGAYPLSDLTLDAEGNLYGTASNGGIFNCGFNNAFGCGTVFELKRSQGVWKLEVLYSFTGGSDGGGLQAGVIFDKAGNLYGTAGALYGGPGTVFKLSPNSHGGWTQSTIYAFNCSGSDGCVPQGDLVFDSQGNLFGTTSSGAGGNCGMFNNGCGAVFELTPHANGSWTETTVHSFAGAPNDGAGPVAGVVFDATGNIYGTTQYGGSGSCGRFSALPPGCGTSYKLTFSAGTWKETLLYDIVRGDGFGIYPPGELFFDNPNRLLGVTLRGGDGVGTVFELNYTREKGWRETQPHIFYSVPDGDFPMGKLAADTKGDLLGVTQSGGGGSGTVFELKHLQNGWKERIVHNFAGPPDGAYPYAGLVSDSQGHLYGTTQGGGAGTGCDGPCGTVYEVTP